MLDDFVKLGEELSERKFYDEAVKAKFEYLIRQDRGRRFVDFDLSAV